MKALLVRTFCVGLLFALIVCTVGRESANGGAQAPNIPAKAHRIEIRDCKKCHRAQGENLDDYKKEGVLDFVQMTEYATWNKQDLHVKAWENLDPKNPIAARMQAILENSESRKGTNYKVQYAMECLTCHSSDKEWTVNPKTGEISAPAVKPGAIDAETKGRFHTADGVNCQSCHGITDVDAWELPHSRPDWREILPGEKLAKGGQLDLRDPKVRAERCASCHIGNPAEGKWVTHEMYAAGHPPLPPLEVGDYLQEQPRHYHRSVENKYFNKLAEDAKNLKGLEERFSFRPKESTDARSVAYGAVAGLQSNLKLFQNDSTPGGLMDFAHFDCASCHHDLKNKSERQNRPEGITGRPPMKLQTDLLEAVVEHAGEVSKDAKWAKHGDNLKGGLKELRAAFTARPFGDPEAVKKASGKLNAVGDAILGDLKSIVYDDKAVQGLIDVIVKRLKAKDAKAYVDVESAQQLTWALVALHKELKAMGKDQDAAKWAETEKALLEFVDPFVREKDENKLTDLRSVEQRLKDRLKKQYESYSSKGFLDSFKK